MTTSVLAMAMDVLRQPQTETLGYSATADSIGANYVLDTSEWLHSRDGDKDDTGKWIWRYNLTDDDAMKQIVRVDIDTGQAYVDGTYNDQDDLEYILLGFYPGDLVNCILASQHKLYREDNVLLSNGGADMDMELPNTDYWSLGGPGNGTNVNCTLTKNSTDVQALAGDFVYSRSQALKCVLTSANGYTRSQRFTRGVRPSAEVVAYVIVTPTIGTVTAQFYDGSGSALFGTQYSYSGESTVIIYMRATTPVGCERVHIQIGGVGSGDTFYVDSCGGPFGLNQARFVLPETVDESYKLPFIRRSRFGDSLGNGVYDAYSRRFAGDYINGRDFHVEAFDRAATANHIVFEDNGMPRLDVPLFLTTRKSRWDDEPLTTVSSTSSAPLGQFRAYVLYELALLLHGKRPEDPRWVQLMGEQQALKGDEDIARPIPAEQPAYEVVRVAF